MPAHARSKLFILKTIAVLAYMTCMLQWFLVVLPFVPPVVNSDVFDVFIAGQFQPSSAPVHTAPALPSWVVAPLVVIITLAVIVATLMSLFRAPRAIGETAQKASRAAAHHVVPIVTHHRKVSKKKRLALTARIIFDLKLLLLGVPLILILFVPTNQVGVSRELFVIMVAILAGWALLLFCLQVALARAFRIPLNQLW